MKIEAFKPGKVRYIKLGKGGAWARTAIDDGIIPLGFRNVEHEICAAGEWDELRRRLTAADRPASGATQDVRELRDFYELPDDTLFVTIADGHLYWAFPDGPAMAVEPALPDGPSRYRRAAAPGWRRTSLAGEPLSVAGLSSALTRTAGYRRTICAIDREDYLLRRIRGDSDPLHAEAATLQASMQTLAVAMIRQLDWREFETLVDLVFTRGGWRRISLLGEDMPDIDLALDQPLTGERAWVQIKTETNRLSSTTISNAS
ncbi:hypothetical protein SAMN02745157_3709 [Kaistia soli DSM 19436]|uniref:Restriction endonuclease type IV Mrr domain-containing protein n=1 Tax=Kaistia soli DSM 19436 TaxID=1122133 RepID=A0A1M5I1G5_9HYPH|nr:restriction endonuclease [Kaistia soli]SHG22118.1 hypothetical protein SAMN02745157_3709 [Kaistia soli DSM 19436]